MSRSQFRIGQYYDSSFEEMEEKEIRDNLEALAYEIIEEEYTKNLTEEELRERKNFLAEVSIKLAALEAEKKELMDEMKLKMKVPKSEKDEVLEVIKHRSERRYGKLYKIDDQDTGMMYFFEATGQCVNARPLTANEKQTKIKQLKAIGNG